MIKHGHVDYRCDGPLATVTLENPESGNQFGTAMAQDLRDVCQAIGQDDSVRLVVITGKGSVFSVGRPTVTDNRAYAGPDGALAWICQHQVASAVAELPIPVIAAVNGDALAQGLELALAADLRIAAADARFGFDNLGQGGIPWDGGN